MFNPHRRTKVKNLKSIKFTKKVGCIWFGIKALDINTIAHESLHAGLEYVRCRYKYSLDFGNGFKAKSIKLEERLAYSVEHIVREINIYCWDNEIFKNNEKS